MLIAQFTDTHIKPEGRLAYGRVDTTALLRQAIEHLHTLPQRTDLLLVTGDLVDAGGADEYVRLRALLDSCAVPWVLIAGNHDDRQQMRIAFPAQPGAQDPRFWQFDIQPGDGSLRILGLDTLLPGDSAGLLCPERLHWLAARLQEQPDTPTLIAMHHPPFITGIGHMDDIGLAGRDAFAELMAQHPQVQLVICGHLHRSIRAVVGGRAVMTAPSTAHTVQLDIARDAAPMFRLEPPGYLLHWWDGQGLVSHQAFTDPSPGPYPFFDDSGRLML
jgi:3',5'-cyclic-AMP phosphodiesterase